MLRIAAFMAAAIAVPGAAQDFTWHGDLEIARAEAGRTDKPLLLLFRCEP